MWLWDEKELLPVCSGTGFCTFVKRAASFALAGCWQVYKGRRTAPQVFVVMDAVPVLQEPVVRRKVKCRNQSVLEKDTF